jgi:hypothetical protein
VPKLELTQEQIETVRALWNTGPRRDQIAAAAGLSVDSLIACKRELGLPDLRRGWRRVSGQEYNPTPAEIVSATAEIRKGWSPEETAVRQGYRPLDEAGTEAARRYRVVPIRDIVGSWG